MKILLSLALLLGLMAPALAQPVITPANLTVNAGASFEFSTSSTNAVTFQWVFDGTNITDATNSAYYVDNPGTNQAGVYWLVTGNTDASVTSNFATLTVVQGTIVNFLFSNFADGSSSNVVVELFDHDKPATVENFVHYIRSGAYSNLFMDRLIPGFVMQGGDYDANDRTNTASGVNASNIFQTFVQGNLVTNPPIPAQVDNEFGVGPYVANVKGTLALALPSGNTNGGNSAFFFNLVDNSGSPNFLDSQMFTVFGRVIGGENVLDYFNDTTNFSKLPESDFPTNLVFTSNPFTNGIFDQVFLGTNATTLTDLPVNYYGTNIPADHNLFFVDFSFPDPNAQPIVDTTPPTVTMTYPPSNLFLTNGTDFTIQGTAQDNVGLAYIECTLTPLNGANGGSPLTSAALGTTNWSLDVLSAFSSLEPGIYNVSATPQDGAGNLGTPVYQTNLIITAVVTNGFGSVVLTNRDTYPAAGSVVTNAVGAVLQKFSDYSIAAEPGTNQIFVNWSFNNGYANLLSATIYFSMSEGFAATATFISNAIPGSVAITYPPPQGTVNMTNGEFALQGTITGLTNTPISITCQLYSTSTELAAGSLLQTFGTNNWILPVTNLTDGEYIAQVIAQDAQGRQTLITNSFTARTVDPLTVVVNGPGAVTTNLNGQYLVPGQTYSMKAAPAANGVFENWNNNGAYSLNPVESFTMSDNLTLTATFLSNGIPGAIAFTYPVPGKPAYATNGVLGIQGTITGLASPPVAITCQLFTSSGQAAGAPLQTSGTSTWSVQTNLANGQYYLQAIAQDALGRTTIITNVLNVQTVNQLTVAVNGPGTVTTDYNGQYLVPGTTYSMKAQPAKNAVFATWSDGVNSTLNPLESFTMSSNLVLTATFINNSIPGAIAFTYPASKAKVTNSALTLAGTIKSSMTATQIVCQLFANSNSVAPPTVASNLNATWSVPPGNLLPGQTNLTPGAYTVVATAYNSTGESTLISESFELLAHLTIVTSPSVVVPTVLGSNNVNTNIVIVSAPQQLGTISLANSNGGYLTPGASYSISAKAKPGYIFAYWVFNGATNYASPFKFSLAADQTITANFASNYFPLVSGTYNGIFYPPTGDATPTNSGALTMSILSTGVTTINLSLPGKAQAYKLSGELPYFCSVDAEVPGLDGNGLVLAFGMDLTNFSDSFTGYVYDANGSWYGNLTAYKAATSLAANSAAVPGRYVLTIPGSHGLNSNQPGGDSFATYSISTKGAVVVAGSLADNTPFTQSTAVSANGIWPLYVPLYPNSKKIAQGVILGWQTNSSPTNFSGQAEWFKPAIAPKAGAYYTGGFDGQYFTMPASYTEPAASTHYQIVFNSPTLAAPLTNHLTVSAAHLFSADAGQAGLVVTLTPTTGAITGQFTDPAGSAPKKISGAFTSPDLGGSGYILDTDGQTGYFEITLLP